MIVAADVGGTFTDVVIIENNKVRTLKVLTDVKKPWRPLKGLIQWRMVKEFIHATTLGTNLFLGQENLEMPDVLFITNDNFEDVIEIGRQNRPEAYNFFFEKPKPLVSRDKRVGVSSLDSIKCSDVIVVGLLNCFKGDEEERLVKKVREICKESIVVGSCEVDPSMGEYERLSTAIINGILKVTLGKYVDEMLRNLRKWGFGGSFYMMNSHGGISEVDEVLSKPVMFIESGPASGAVASSYILRELGLYYGISFDMGGTTAKASLIINGEPLTTDYFEVGGKYHMGTIVRGTGYPVRVPHVDLVEVSGGGGTIIWVDKGGALRVGPLSAGADPGPACYGRGEKATVTDANLVLGRLPESISSLRLRRDKAIEALKEVAKKVGKDYIEVAVEALNIINEEMARSIKLVSVYRGWEPSRMNLIAYGGAGPQHALEIAEMLGISQVIIPFFAGVFSALGLAFVDFKKEIIVPIEDNIKIEKLKKMINERVKDLKGYDEIITLVEVAFKGQLKGKEYPIGEDLYERYMREFEDRYGFRPSAQVITKKVRIIAIKRRPKVKLTEELGKLCCEREVYDKGWVKAKVYKGIPERVRGTAVIETENTTIFVPRGWEGKRNEVGMMFTRSS